jgi:hypothetical protein
MTPTGQRILVRFAWGALVVLIAAGPVGGTPITGGNITLEFTNELTPMNPWEIKVTLHWATPSDNGQVALTSPALAGGMQEVVLFEGPIATGDSIEWEYMMPPPPPGRYHVVARYKQHPEREQGYGGATKVAYVLVREDTVFLAWTWDKENMENELEYELRQRGLEEVDPKQLDSLAPDLAERWRKVKGWRAIGPPPNPRKEKGTLPIDVSDRVFTVPDRDTIAFPGSGPPL